MKLRGCHRITINVAGPANLTFLVTALPVVLFGMGLVISSPFPRSLVVLLSQFRFVVEAITLILRSTQRLKWIPRNVDTDCALLSPPVRTLRAVVNRKQRDHQV